MRRCDSVREWPIHSDDLYSSGFIKEKYHEVSARPSEASCKQPRCFHIALLITPFNVPTVVT